jgi:hypothetical protein
VGSVELAVDSDARELNTVTMVIPITIVNRARANTLVPNALLLCETSVALCVSVVKVRRKTLTTEAQSHTEITQRRPCRSGLIILNNFPDNPIINSASLSALVLETLLDDFREYLPCQA